MEVWVTPYIDSWAHSVSQAQKPHIHMHFPTVFCNPDTGSKSTYHYSPQGPLCLEHLGQPISSAIRTLPLIHTRGHLGINLLALRLLSPQGLHFLALPLPSADLKVTWSEWR